MQYHGRSNVGNTVVQYGGRGTVNSDSERFTRIEESLSLLSGVEIDPDVPANVRALVTDVNCSLVGALIEKHPADVTQENYLNAMAAIEGENE